MHHWVQFKYACQITLWGNPVGGSLGSFTRHAYVAVPADWISHGAISAVEKLDDLAKRIFYHESEEHYQYLVANDCYDGAGRILLGIEHAVLGPVEEDLREWTPPENGNIRSVNGQNFYQVNPDGRFKFVEPTKLHLNS